MILKLCAVLAIENAVQPVDTKKTADVTVPQFYAFSPLNAFLTPGGRPLTCTNSDATGGSSARINQYGSLYNMHAFCETMEPMVMM